MSSVNDFIRSFGMSGMLIEEELKGIEEKFSLDLGLRSKVVDEGPVEYYPQFEQSVRAEAAEMARHYELFYCLEKAIRKLISETLHESDGVGWWDKGRVPADIVNDVKNNIQREMDSGVTEGVKQIV